MECPLVCCKCFDFVKGNLDMGIRHGGKLRIPFEGPR